MSEADAYISRRDMLRTALGGVAAYVFRMPSLSAQGFLSLQDILGEEKRKLPVPNVLDIKAKEEFIKGLLKDDYAKLADKKTDDATKALFAEKLFSQATETKDDPIAQYVLLRDARDIGASAKAFDTTFNAVSTIYDTFQVSLENVIDEASRKFPRNGGMSKDDVIGHANYLVKVAKYAIDQNQYDSALNAAKEAVTKARFAKEQADEANILAKQVPELKREYEEVKIAVDKLNLGTSETKPNTTIGKYLCFRKQDWQKGLPYLQKGDDLTLKMLAGMEITPPTEAKGQYDLGERWYSIAQNHKKESLEKGRYAGRARTWFEQALPNSTGLLKAQIEKRLKEMEPATTTSTTKGGIVDLLKMIDPKRDAVSGDWAGSRGVLVSPDSNQARLKIPYVPGTEYDLKVFASRKTGNDALIIGLTRDGHQCDLVLDGWGGSTSGIDTIDGKKGYENGTTYKNKVFNDDAQKAIVCSVRDNNLTISVGGKSIITWKPADYTKMSPYVRLPESDVLFLGSNSTSYQIHKIEYVPVSGKHGPQKK